MSSRLAVMMCVYQRPERLRSTFEMLSRQTHKNFDLFIWNNGLDPDLIKTLDEFANFPVHTFGHGKNIGPWAKLLMGHIIYFLDGHERVVTIDDDQIFQPDALAVYVEESVKNFGSIVSSFAFNFGKKKYWDREGVKPGCGAEYGLSGGMIVPSVFYANTKVYEIPSWFGPLPIHDLWMSYIASRKGWCFMRSAVEPVMVNDGKDSWISHREEKVKALEYLRSVGWKV